MSHSDKSTVSIDPDLQARLTALASKNGQTVSELAEHVLRGHADQQERLAAEYAEDEERWQRYLETGETIPFDAVRSKLQGMAGKAAHLQDAS